MSKHVVNATLTVDLVPTSIKLAEMIKAKLEEMLPKAIADDTINVYAYLTVSVGEQKVSRIQVLKRDRK